MVIIGDFLFKFNLNEDICIDPHLGVFASYTFAGSVKDGDESWIWSDFTDDENYTCYDFGLKLGAGIWYKKFNFDISWQRGFVEKSSYYGFKTSNLILSVGYAF